MSRPGHCASRRSFAFRRTTARTKEGHPIRFGRRRQRNGQESGPAVVRSVRLALPTAASMKAESRDGVLPIVRLRAIDLGPGRDPLEGEGQHVDVGPLLQLRPAWLAQGLPPQADRARG